MSITRLAILVSVCVCLCGHSPLSQEKIKEVKGEL